MKARQTGIEPATHPPWICFSRLHYCSDFLVREISVIRTRNYSGQELFFHLNYYLHYLSWEYSRTRTCNLVRDRDAFFTVELCTPVKRAGIEPAASGVEGQRSSVELPFQELGDKQESNLQLILAKCIFPLLLLSPYGFYQV